MERFRETAFYLTLWYALMTFLGAVPYIIMYGFDLATESLIAANLTLLFAFFLWARTRYLTERSILRGQLWQAIPARERPPGEVGIRMAREALREMFLRFAHGATAVAIMLACVAYASHNADASSWTHADYETVRVDPTN